MSLTASSPDRMRFRAPARDTGRHEALRLVLERRDQRARRRAVQAQGKNREVVEEMFATAGASLTGRRTYDRRGWNGTHPVNGVPVVVLTRRAPKKCPRGNRRSRSPMTS